MGGKKTMGEIILKPDIKRETGYLYYCGTDKETGNITVCKAKMARGGKKKKVEESM